MQLRNLVQLAINLKSWVLQLVLNSFAFSYFLFITHNCYCFGIIIGRPMKSCYVCNASCKIIIKLRLPINPDFSECNSSAFTTRAHKVKEDPASKILNAPGASKNFYYNLVDWGANNIVVIGLKEDVYYWDAIKCEFDMNLLSNMLNNKAIIDNHLFHTLGPQ